MTFPELAALVGGAAGSHAADLTRVSSIPEATVACVVFASDARTLAEAAASPAGAILIPSRLADGSDQRYIAVPDPRFAFSLAATHLRAASRLGVHATAIVASGVSLGAEIAVGPWTVLEEGVQLGARCVIGSHVTIHAGTRLGDRVIVQAGAVLGSTGFGYARDPESGNYLLFPQQGTLSIGDDVEIGANTTIDRGALGETRIGRGTKIDNLVHIGHNCLIGSNVIIAAQTGISGSSVIEDGAILGGQVGIGEHATVGKGVILGGGAGVLTGKKMQGSGEVFWGRPARPLKEYLGDLARLRRDRRPKP